MPIQFWAKNSTVHVLSIGTFNFDLDTPEGSSIVLQSIENGETCYFHEDTGGESIPAGDWSYRIWLSRGGGGPANPTVDISIAILDNLGIPVETIVGPDNYTLSNTASTLFTGSSIGEGAKTVGATERVALIIDNVVAGAREAEVNFDSTAALFGDTLIVRPLTAGAGYDNDVQGVPSANIGKVQGVDTANIAKVSGS